METIAICKQDKDWIELSLIREWRRTDELFMMQHIIGRARRFNLDALADELQSDYEFEKNKRKTA